MNFDSKSLSWGRVCDFPQEIKTPFWRDELSTILKNRGERSLLAGGAGRSYGDSGLNSKGVLVKMPGLNRLLEFDGESGFLSCEAGMFFADILEFIVPRGWFLPVTPGTMFVTVGGAIANDVHGKNHHVAGTFGCFVESMEILSSAGEIVVCSPERNSEKFRATIGGLGLTGIILSAKIRLKKIGSSLITQRATKFSRIDEFFQLDAASDLEHDYTVAWIDSSAAGKSLGRGLFYQGDHAPGDGHGGITGKRSKSILTVPFVPPGYLLNEVGIRAFNYCYYNRQQTKSVDSIVPYRPFFYPLDGIANWNRVYGPKGFYQFQCALPEGKTDHLTAIIAAVARSPQSSFVTVLKKFGSIRSPGMLSFPIPGYTITFDFRNLGRPTIDLIRSLSAIVAEGGGRVYPAKDALMTSEEFKAGYPAWREFAQHVDPGFSSNFWQRVV